MTLTKKRVKSQIREERKSSTWYRIHGFPGIAKDETRHKKVLQRKLKRMK